MVRRRSWRDWYGASPLGAGTRYSGRPSRATAGGGVPSPAALLPLHGDLAGSGERSCYVQRRRARSETQRARARHGTERSPLTVEEHEVVARVPSPVGTHGTRREDRRRPAGRVHGCCHHHRRIPGCPDLVDLDVRPAQKVTRCAAVPTRTLPNAGSRPPAGRSRCPLRVHILYRSSHTRSSSSVRATYTVPGPKASTARSPSRLTCRTRRPWPSNTS